MSLYGDLPKAKDEPEPKKSGWAQNQLKGTFLPPSAMQRGSGVLAGRGVGRGAGRGPGAGRGHPNAIPSSAALPSPSSDPIDVHGGESGRSLNVSSLSTAVEGPSLFSSVHDEYDPLSPNDYLAVSRERELQLKRAIEEADKAIKLREVQRQVAQLEKKGHEQELRSAGLASTSVKIDHDAPPSMQNILKGSTGGLTAAQKMMEKMGWKAGTGLGRNNQGITAPLIATRVDGRTAVVTTGDPDDHIGLGGRGGAPAAVRSEDRDRGPDSVAERRREREITERASRVLLLTNMVAPGQVDDSLEDEVAEESTRFGPVARVTIFEVTTAGYPVEEAVRIFVEFRDKASCIAAYRDLDGRFFGGRQVRARFFDEGRFAATDLAPGPEEGDPSAALEALGARGGAGPGIVQGGHAPGSSSAHVVF